jgi:hypothetical protein
MPIDARPIWIPLNAIEERTLSNIWQLLGTLAVLGMSVQNGQYAYQPKKYCNVSPGFVTQSTLVWYRKKFIETVLLGFKKLTDRTNTLNKRDSDTALIFLI